LEKTLEICAGLTVEKKKFRLMHWSLVAKLMLVGIPFMLLVLLATGATLWVSWQLDGGAAAVNEAGRMRMQSYRLALSIGTQDQAPLQTLITDFNQSLSTLKHGDPERPLFVPWDDNIRARFAKVEADWHDFQQRWMNPTLPPFQELHGDTVRFATDIDAFVLGIESHIAHWTVLLHLLQLSMLALVIVVAVILLYTGYLFVLEPVGELKKAIEKIQAGDFQARVAHDSSDEFGTLADGFNGMAEHLHSLYQNLEAIVAEKTAELREKSERLESLYEVTALVANATALEALGHAFTTSLARIARADAVALRWSGQGDQRHLMLASSGLPGTMLQAEQCIYTGNCHCGVGRTQQALTVIPIQSLSNPGQKHCANAGFATVVTLPIRLHERHMGEVNLFFNARVEPSVAERSLFEALGMHLASGMENLRLNALEKEAAVSQERHLLARELHDSIAQSLAFLKIQVQLLRDALRRGAPDEIESVLEEIDVGVRESYSDVRELLLHFRTRTNTEDIQTALLTTLQKFEHQSAIKTSFNMQGEGLPLPPDQQIQVLHIIQESLSNVRKHAQATHVWLDVQQQPAWRFVVRDNGAGFDPLSHALDETHVGLKIMLERAHRIGASLSVTAAPHMGCTVTLALASPTVRHP
jgi:two-component system, NarL family, nitrate/nitrite sensor histidine kinase NarX